MKRILAVVLLIFAGLVLLNGGPYWATLNQAENIPMGLALAFTFVTLVLVSLKLFFNPTRRVSITLSENHLLFISLNAFLLAFAILFQLYSAYQQFALFAVPISWQEWAIVATVDIALAWLFLEFATDCLRVRATDAAHTGHVTFAWMPVRLDTTPVTSQAAVAKAMKDIRAHVLMLNKKKGKRARR